MTHLNFTQQLIKNRWSFLWIVLAVSLILVEIIHNVYRLFFTTVRYDFYNSYLAARALILGTPLYESGNGLYIYPPFYAFILTLPAHLSENSAHLIWLGVNVSLIVIILFLGFRVLASGFQLRYSRWQAAGACALAVLLSQDQIHWELVWNENDLLILAGFALALFWLDKKPFMAGASLGLTAIIKYQGLFFLPFLIFRARWRVVMGLLAGAAAGAFLPALMIGWDRNLQYLLIALRGLANMTRLTQLPLDHAAHVPAVTWSANISVSSAVLRIFHDHGWQQNHAYLLLMGIAVFIFFLLREMFQRQGIAFIWRTPQSLKNPEQEKIIVNLEWCALLICMMAFTPQGLRRHLILLLNVNLLTAVMLLFPRPRVSRWPLVVGVIIVQLALLRLPGTALYHFEDYLGIPYWGFLIFLPILISSGLTYYRDIYPTAQSPTESKGSSIHMTLHSFEGSRMKCHVNT